MEIIKVILVSLLSAAILFILTKLMGHKQLAQLDFFDYICGITIGSIAAELATELESPIRPIIAMIVYGAASIALNIIMQKFPRSRKYINGSPTILLSGGKLYRENLKTAKLDLSEFLILCRESGYFDLSEIGTAVFEPNGKLTILPKSKNRPLEPSDMNITPPEAHMSTELVMEGRIMGENLKRMGRDRIWLYDELEKLGYKSPSKVFLALYDETNGVSAFGYEN